MQTFREKQKAKSTTKPYTYKAKIVHQKLPYKTAYLQPVRSNIITMKNNDNSPISKGSGRK